MKDLGIFRLTLKEFLSFKKDFQLLGSAVSVDS